MLKRGLSLLLVLVMLFAVGTVLPTSALGEEDENNAEDFVYRSALSLGDGTLYYTITADAALITGAEELAGDITLPEEIDDYPLTAIGANAFTACPALTSVVIPISVQTIGANAFPGGDLVIMGYTDSAAASYAAQNGLTFAAIDPIYFPHITSFENLENGVKISWEPFGIDAHYCVYYRGADGEWVLLTQVADTTALDTSVTDSETRVYAIRALDEAGDVISDLDPDGVSHTFYAPPVIKSLANTVDGVTLTWDRAEGAGDYRIYRRKTDERGWTRLTQTVDSAFTDTTAVSGTRYTYTLRIVDAEDNFMSDHNGGKSITYVAAPVFKSIENTEDGVKLTWDKVPGADHYRLYYKNSRGSWTRMATKYQTSYVDTDVRDGGSYVYTIRCLDENEDFVSDFYRDGWSNTFFAPPVITALSVTTDGVSLRWNRTAGAGEYRVYRRKPGDRDWTRLTQTSASAYTDTTPVSGTRYTYTLRIVDEQENFVSDYNSGKSITYVAAPVIKNIENTEDGAKLTWNKVAGADFYRIYYKDSRGGWTRLASKYLTEYVDTSVKNGETRVYTIRCLNEDEDFVSDFYADGRSNTFYAAPIIKDLEGTADGVVLSWDRTTDAGSYRVYRRRAGDSGWTRLTETGATSYTDTSAAYGTTYTYTLRLVDEDGDFLSDYTSGKRLTYCSVPTLRFENAANGVRISWDKVPGADHYRLYYKNSRGGWTRMATKYQTSYVDTDVRDGGSYTYTIRCLDADDNFASDYDHDGWRYTFCAPPAITSVKRTGNSNLITWRVSKGAAAYRLYRRGVNGSWSRVFDSTFSTSFTDSGAANKVYAYTVRCLDANGELLSDYIDDVPYYYSGSIAEGNIYDGGTYGFKNGRLLKGFNRVGGKLRYYSSEGRMYRDTVVGSASAGYYYTDPDGICCESKEMRLAAEFLMKYCKGNTLKEKAKYGFLYMAKNYPYIRVYNDMPSDESDVAPFAVELFEIGRGTCYRYAAAYACVMKIAGYRSRFVYGLAGTMPHGWTEVYVDGRWLICDVDTQLPSYGFADYEPYMMRNHIWVITKSWSSELTVRDGKAVWGKRTNF